MSQITWSNLALIYERLDQIEARLDAIELSDATLNQQAAQAVIDLQERVKLLEGDSQ